MTVTISELSREDFPVNVISGTGKRRVLVHGRGTAAAGDGFSLTAYTGLQDINTILGVVYLTDTSAAAGSATSNITYVSASANFAYAGTVSFGLLCELK